jgi:hypothetical protein
MQQDAFTHNKVFYKFIDGWVNVIRIYYAKEY